MVIDAFTAKVYIILYYALDGLPRLFDDDKLYLQEILSLLRPEKQINPLAY